MPDYNLKIILDRITEGTAVFITEKGQQIFWPEENLPDDIKPGHTMFLTLTNTIKTPEKQITTKNNKPRGKADKDLAIKILEEILNGKKSTKLKK